MRLQQVQMWSTFMEAYLTNRQEWVMFEKRGRSFKTIAKPKTVQFMMASPTTTYCLVKSEYASWWLVNGMQYYPENGKPHEAQSALSKLLKLLKEPIKNYEQDWTLQRCQEHGAVYDECILFYQNPADRSLHHFDAPSTSEADFKTLDASYQVMFAVPELREFGWRAIKSASKSFPVWIISREHLEVFKSEWAEPRAVAPLQSHAPAAPPEAVGGYNEDALFDIGEDNSLIVDHEQKADTPESARQRKSSRQNSNNGNGREWSADPAENTINTENQEIDQLNSPLRSKDDQHPAALPPEGQVEVEQRAEAGEGVKNNLKRPLPVEEGEELREQINYEPEQKRMKTMPEGIRKRMSTVPKDTIEVRKRLAKEPEAKRVTEMDEKWEGKKVPFVGSGKRNDAQEKGVVRKRREKREGRDRKKREEIRSKRRAIGNTERLPNIKGGEMEIIDAEKEDINPDGDVMVTEEEITGSEAMDTDEEITTSDVEAMDVEGEGRDAIEAMDTDVGNNEARYSDWEQDSVL